ncbi:hypothetical protein L1887_48432 [Cichorium endivia]|nr:hypothetical protein L1887_48432 [Cichorium endivia]
MARSSQRPPSWSSCQEAKSAGSDASAKHGCEVRAFSLSVGAASAGSARTTRSSGVWISCNVQVAAAGGACKTCRRGLGQHSDASGNRIQVVVCMHRGSEGRTHGGLMRGSKLRMHTVGACKRRVSQVHRSLTLAMSM